MSDPSNRLSRPNLAHFMRDRTEIERRAARLFGYIRQGAVVASYTAFRWPKRRRRINCSRAD
jgi:hypothetical protein